LTENLFRNRSFSQATDPHSDLPWTALQQGGFKPDIVVAEKPEDETRRRQPVEVWLHNDDYTPAEYVVTVLEQVFGLGWWKANWIMAKAHATGHAVVGTFPRAEAEQKVAAAERRARSDGWPLRLSVEDPEA
jgi:ATP-dependent Clp protease adaptor protein ClpS